MCLCVHGADCVHRQCDHPRIRTVSEPKVAGPSLCRVDINRVLDPGCIERGE